MSNDMGQSGMCTVVGMWTRAILRQESCGDGCTRSICSDDYVAEFAWVGGPTNDASAGMGYSTSKVDMTEVDMATLDVRINTQCVGGCDRFGGWMLNGTVADRSRYTNVALSQGWRVERCRYCSPCGDGDLDDDNDHGADYHPAPPWGYPEHPVSEATGIVVGDNVVCRMPAEGAANVPGSYDCPDPNFNSLCARLADLPDIELGGGKADAQRLVLAGAICLGIGGTPWTLVLLFMCCHFGKSHTEKKATVKKVVRQASAKNMINIVREISSGNSTRQESPSVAGPAAFAADKPVVATVSGVVLTDVNTAGMTTTSGVVVAGTPA